MGKFQDETFSPKKRLKPQFFTSSDILKGLPIAVLLFQLVHTEAREQQQAKALLVWVLASLLGLFLGSPLGAFYALDGRWGRYVGSIEAPAGDHSS